VSLNLEHIIQQCKQQEPEAQKKLYEMYKDNLYAICIRYVKSNAEAEDVFIEGFYKILTKIDMYKGEGSFEGWMRRIMVNECLMYIRKQTNLHMTVAIPDQDIADEVMDDETDFDFDQIMRILDELPTGYRTVFNLYVFEGYKHREIAEMLSISINTSKSQLIMAKKKIVEALKKKDNVSSIFSNKKI
jgi:RNA polymerase sigma-70 factor (ECF subfamily)